MLRPDLSQPPVEHQRLLVRLDASGVAALHRQAPDGGTFKKNDGVVAGKLDLFGAPNRLEEGLPLVGPVGGTVDRSSIAQENPLWVERRLHVLQIPLNVEDGALGSTRRYDFTVENRPGTYWYHPHPEGRTGFQVHAGMAGFFLVTDADDAARGLPAPEFDLPLVIQDRILDGDSQLVYAPNQMLGFLGDRILVNGRADASLDVKAGTYRLRLLNGSNARIYKLAWSDGSPMKVIGTDGGLVAAPIERSAVLLAPGERIELWADFGSAPAGDSVWLESRAFAMGGGMMGGGMMGGGMMGGGGASNAPPNGAALRICRFVIAGKGPRLPIPGHLSPPEWRSAEEVVNRQNPRTFAVSMAMMRWVLNGQPFDMTGVAANERIKLGATEEWEFSNPGAMMTIAHPIHVHGGQFQIVQRAVAPAWRGVAATMDDGLVDDGWKDTFLLRPGEQVRIRVRFARHAGLFLYHCHNLEHEDMGMMRNFRVEG
jgi:blue copper oxidase